MLAKEIAEELSLPSTTVNFRLFKMRQETPDLACLYPPFTRDTLDAVANFLTRQVPDFAKPAEEKSNKNHFVAEKNKALYKALEKAQVEVTSDGLVKAKDGTSLRIGAVLYRWNALGSPEPVDDNILDVILCSVDTKTFNKKRFEAGYVRKNSVYGLLWNNVQVLLVVHNSEKGTEIEKIKKARMSRVKAIREEFGVDNQVAILEWLLEERYICHETYWSYRDIIDARIAARFSRATTKANKH